MAGVVIDLSQGNSTNTIGFTNVALNYNDLSAIVGTAIGELSYVENSQGTQWLPGTVGGTYYPKGIYIWNGTSWVSDRNSIAEQLDINVEDINQLQIDVATKISDAPSDGNQYVRRDNGWEVVNITSSGYEEKWELITPNQFNGWHTIPTSYINKELGINIRTLQNNRIGGVREVGSTNDRRVRIDIDSTSSLPVKTDGNGDIQLYAQNAGLIFRLVSIRNI